jgi:hypothetical protein
MTALEHMSHVVSSHIGHDFATEAGPDGFSHRVVIEVLGPTAQSAEKTAATCGSLGTTGCFSSGSKSLGSFD